MYQLEGHLAEAHRQAQRLIRQQGSLGTSLAEFGSSMVSLGRFEQGSVADGFIGLGEKAETLARSSRVRPAHACILLFVGNRPTCMCALSLFILQALSMCACLPNCKWRVPMPSAWLPLHKLASCKLS